VVIAFDPGHRVIGHIVFQGTASECAVLPQHVFQFLILSCAGCFILAHNHPGGTREPSIADWRLTKKLYATGNTLSIRLVDHIIISDAATISMRSMSQWPTI
jgi:DNA repair protein RadC